MKNFRKIKPVYKIMNRFCSLVANDFLDNTTEIRKLGEGSYGSVYLVQDSNGEEYAIKYMKINESGITGSSLIDINTLIQLKNVPNIINLIGICYQKEKVSMILEPMDSDLSNFIKTTPLYNRLKLAPKLLKDLIRATAFMETLNIVHFDIKPENILMKGTEFKLTDFGLSKPLFGGDSAPLSEVYTLNYRSPELLSYRDRNSYNIFASAIWAIGMTLLNFVTEHGFVLSLIDASIFDFVDNKMVLIPIKTATPRSILEDLYNINKSYSMSLDEFIIDNQKGTITGNFSIISDAEPIINNMLHRMLAFNPDQRPTAVELLNEFGEEPNFIFLEQLLLPIYPRKIHKDAASMILEIAKMIRISKSSTLIALEIFTRYLGTLNNNEVYQNIYNKAIASLKIASEFGQSYFDQFFYFADYYDTILTKFKFNTTQLIEIEKDILNKLSFHIYNMNLTPIIKKLYEEGIDLAQVDLNQFVKPVTLWLREV